jgi:hypothetical protein
MSQAANCVQNNAFTFSFLANSVRNIFFTPPYWECFVVSFTKTGKRFLGNVLFSLYFMMASEFSRIQVRQNEVKVTIFCILLQLALSTNFSNVKRFWVIRNNILVFELWQKSRFHSQTKMCESIVIDFNVLATTLPSN